MLKKRIVCMALVCVFTMGMLAVPASAAETDKTSVNNFVMNSLNSRATGSFNMTISAKTTMVADRSFPLATGETVTIKASYAPSNASVDFGLVDSDGVFHYVNVTNGSIDKTILIEANGNYTLQIRNHSDGEVKVSGFVNY